MASLAAVKRESEGIRFSWSHDHSAVVPIRDLRLACPCARCVSEVTGQALLVPESVPEDIELVDMQPVGNYAYKLLFSDGHDSGIYTLEQLSELSCLYK